MGYRLIIGAGCRTRNRPNLLADEMFSGFANRQFEKLNATRSRLNFSERRAAIITLSL